MRQFKAIGFAVILLISNIGIPVYSHICHTLSRSWSSIYIPAKSCCSKPGSAMSDNVCTDRNSYLPEFSQRPCCENQKGLIQLESEFVQYLPQLLIALSDYLDADHFYYFSLSQYLPESKMLSQKPHGPPLLLYGRSLLIAEQIFRC